MLASKFPLKLFGKFTFNKDFTKFTGGSMGNGKFSTGLRTTGVSIEEILSYDSGDIIFSFRKKYDISEDEANLICSDMLRFLWMCAQKKHHLLPVIDEPLLVIDEMWHVFILFTKEYKEFCYKYFGKFIDHCPTKEDKMDNIVPLDDEYVKKKRVRYSKILELMGEEVFSRWFLEYPEKYSRKKLYQLRKP